MGNLGHRRGNDFSVGGAKIEQLFGWGSKTLLKTTQLNSKYNFVQYVIFEKGIYAVYNGVWGKAPEAGGIFENLCVKSNLTVCKVTVGELSC